MTTTSTNPTSVREIESEDFVSGRIKMVIPRSTRSGKEYFQIAADTDESGVITFDLWKDEDMRIPLGEDAFTALIQKEKVTMLANGREFTNRRALLIQIDS